MANEDRVRWDERYDRGGPSGVHEVNLPAVFVPYAASFPTAGHVLDLACGRGLAAVWFARRGMDVLGVDVSPVAITRARQLAESSGVTQRCRFQVADLDDGLPSGPSADVVLCHRFRDSRLHPAIRARLAPGGLLAICVLSEVGAKPGPFRAAAGELQRSFAALDVIAAGEADGEAWLLGRS